MISLGLGHVGIRPSLDADLRGGTMSRQHGDVIPQRKQLVSDPREEQFAVTAGQNPNVLGNEALPGNADKAQTGGNGRNKAPPDAAKPEVALDKSDVVHGVNPLNRESEAVQSETIIQQYNDLVDQYFKAITKEPKKAAKP